MRLLIEHVRGRLAQAPRDLTPQVGGRIYKRAREMAKSNQTKAFIRKGEIFFLNGALIRAHDSVNLEIMISDTFLLPSQIVSESTSVSHLQKIYYFIQQMLIEPNFRNQWQNRLELSLVNLSPGTRRTIQEAVKANELQKLLGIIRQEIKTEITSLVSQG